MKFELRALILSTENRYLKSTRISHDGSYLFMGVNYSYLSVLMVLGGTSVEDSQRIVPSFFYDTYRFNHQGSSGKTGKDTCLVSKKDQLRATEHILHIPAAINKHRPSAKDFHCLTARFLQVLLKFSFSYGSVTSFIKPRGITDSILQKSK